MLADNLEIRTARKIADLEKRISDLERLVSWLVGLLIDLVAVGLGVAGALFVANFGLATFLVVFLGIGSPIL